MDFVRKVATSQHGVNILEFNHGWIIYKKATAFDIINIVAFEKEIQF